MGAIAGPRSVDSSDRSNLMRAFIIGNGINRARLSYDLMDALSPDRWFVPPTALKKTERSPQTTWSLRLIIVIFMVAIGLPCSFSARLSIKRYFITRIRCHFVSPKRLRGFFGVTIILCWIWFLFYNDRAAWSAPSDRTLPSLFAMIRIFLVFWLKLSSGIFFPIIIIELVEAALFLCMNAEV